MKLATRIFSLLVMVALALFTGCGSDDGDDKSDEEQQLAKLSSSWTLVSANDGTDRTADFPQLVLTLSGTFAQSGTYDYSFTGTRPNPNPWPASGKWKFGTNPATDIIRDPNKTNEKDMNYAVTESQLIISFNIPEGAAGEAGGTTRASSVKGDWQFTFQKK
jgi:hypothetical protein